MYQLGGDSILHPNWFKEIAQVLSRSGSFLIISCLKILPIYPLLAFTIFPSYKFVASIREPRVFGVISEAIYISMPQVGFLKLRCVYTTISLNMEGMIDTRCKH